eukprot:253897_1
MTLSPVTEDCLKQAVREYIKANDLGGIEESGSTNFNKSYQPVTLLEIFRAGVETLDCKTVSERRETAEKDDVFQEFLMTVKSRGYFDECEEGTEVYEERYSKVVLSYEQKKAASSVIVSSGSENQIEDAEKAKKEGNEHFKAKRYAEAIAEYTRALDASPEGPQSHVYLCNRAAAEIALNEWDNAERDCLAAIDLAPNYSKAYGRLGHVYFSQQDFTVSVKAYEKSIDLEPNNKTHRDGLDMARNKLQHAAAPSGAGAGGGGVEDMLKGMGGMPPGGLSGVMNNPQFMSMAQNMMKDPNMMKMAENMMKDPQAMGKMMGMMGGGGREGGGGGNSIPGFNQEDMARMAEQSNAMEGAGGEDSNNDDDDADMMTDPDMIRLQNIMQVDGPMAAMAEAEKNSELLQKAMKLMQQKRG